MSGVDRISLLTDPILSHILSFLPTKTIVESTTSLSRRWMHLWLSVPTVDLEDSTFWKNPDAFVRFAYAVMLSRDFTKPILNFRLKCEISSIPSCDVNLWLKIAIQRKVETIDLSSSCNYPPMELPTAILTCSSLVVLKLKNVIVDRTSTVHLPFLKSLHMDGVRFVKGEYLEMILSGCPNIQDLQIKGLDMQPSFIPLAAVTLTNLIRMELFVSGCQWFWIAGLLNSCPFLQVLDVGGDNWARELGLPDQPVPGCLSSHLRACTLRDFDGAKSSMEFATYIVRNARVLNKMTIYCQRSIEVEDKYRILRKICKVPRAFPLWLE